MLLFATDIRDLRRCQQLATVIRALAIGATAGRSQEPPAKLRVTAPLSRRLAMIAPASSASRIGGSPHARRRFATTGPLTFLSLLLIRLALIEAAIRHLGCRAPSLGFTADYSTPPPVTFLRDSRSGSTRTCRPRRRFATAARAQDTKYFEFAADAHLSSRTGATPSILRRRAEPSLRRLRRCHGAAGHRRDESTPQSPNFSEASASHRRANSLIT